MSVRLQKKSLIWMGGIVLLILVLILVLPLLFRVHSPEKEQYKAEKKHLSEIFKTLDSTFWKNKNQSISLNEEAIRISKKINDSNALAQALFNKSKILQESGEIDSSFIFSNQALILAEKFHNETLTAKIKNNIGNHYFIKDNYYLSMLYYTDVKKIAENLHNDHFICLAYNGLGIVYYKLKDYDRAIEYFKRVDSIYQKTGEGNVWNAISALLNIASCYVDKNDLSMATFYDKKVLAIAERMHDTDAICRTYIDFGRINKDLKNNTASSMYFHQALKLAKQVNNRLLYGDALQNLGIFYAYDNQLTKAKDLLNQCLSIFSEVGSKNGEMEVYSALSEVKQKQGQWQGAFEYHTRYMALRDSILNIQTQKKISDYQWEIESQKKRFEQELLQNKYEIQKKRNLIFILLSIFVIMYAIGFSRYLKKSIKLQKIENVRLQEKIDIGEKMNELEKYKHKAELDGKNKELTSLSIQVVTKNELLTNISETTNKLYKSQMLDKASFNNLDRIIKESVNVDKDWEQFKSMFEKVHENFFIKLKQVGPELSENELRLCAYLKINLSNNEIARIFNINPGTLKINRHHIRKKLNLDSKTNLNEYIREV